MKTFHKGGRGSTLFHSMKFIPLYFLFHEKMSLREDDGDDDDMFDGDDDVNDDDMFDGCQGRKQARKGEVAASSCSRRSTCSSHHFRHDDDDDDHVDHDGQ